MWPWSRCVTPQESLHVAKRLVHLSFGLVQCPLKARKHLTYLWFYRSPQLRDFRGSERLKDYLKGTQQSQVEIGFSFGDFTETVAGHMGPGAAFA